MDVWPLLAVGYVDLISFGENLQGSTMETRKKAPNEILNEEEVNTERAVHAGRRRAGHLGELRNVSWPLVLMPLPFPSAILKWIRYNGLSHTLALSMGILLGHCSSQHPLIIATATEIYPAFVSQQTYLCQCSTRTSLLSH